MNQAINIIFDFLKLSGAKLKFNKKNSVTVSRKKIKSLNIKTIPYPGFPTDMQAQLMSLLCLGNGKSIIKEDIFENRFLHVSELKRMGANIKIKNKKIKTRTFNTNGSDERQYCSPKINLPKPLKGSLESNQEIIFFLSPNLFGISLQKVYLLFAHHCDA